MSPMVRSGWQDSAKSFVATPTRSPPKVPFNKRLRGSMVRKRFATRRSSATSRREAMKP